MGRVAGTLAKIKTWGIWFQGRNTPHVKDAPTRSQAISRARADKPAGHDKPVDSARVLTGKSLSQARKGRWVRERATGRNTGGSSTYRPQFKNTPTVRGRK